MQTRILKGHWVSDSGQLSSGSLAVDVNGMGVVYDSEGGEALEARVETIVPGHVTDAITNGVWLFYSLIGECQRAGIVVLGAND